MRWICKCPLLQYSRSNNAVKFRAPLFSIDIARREDLLRLGSFHNELECRLFGPVIALVPHAVHVETRRR